MTTRPGFGLPHEAFTALVGGRRPASTEVVSWADGAVQFDLAVHFSPVGEVPDELITSARCIVRVGDRVVLCTNADGSCNVVPGGRRESGESAVDAAVREVHEETGWHLDTGTVREIGWLHFRYRTPVAPEFARYPHPDFVHAAYTAHATERDGAQGGEWTDTEGYVVASRLVSVDEALVAMPAGGADRVLLERVAGRR